MYGVGISLAPGGGGGAKSLIADRTRFAADAPAGTTLARLRDPFGGATFEVVGTPAALALSGGRIVRGPGEAAAGARIAIKVRATSADGRREVAETIELTADEPAVPGAGPRYLPALGTAGARYHAVYGTERLVAGGQGPLIGLADVTGRGAVALGEGAARVDPIALAEARGAAEAVRVERWYDQTGGGRDLTQADAASRPAISDAIRLSAAMPVLIDGQTQTIARWLGGVHAIPDRLNQTCFAVIDPGVSVAPQVWWEYRNGTSAVRDTYTAIGQAGGLQAAMTEHAVRIAAAPQVVVVVERASGSRVFVDGIRHDGPPGQGGGGLGAVMLGASGTAGAIYNSTLRIAAWGAIEGALDDTDVLALDAALADRHGIDRSPPTGNLVLIGDSIQQGIGGTLTRNCAWYLRPQLIGRPRLMNLGVNARTLAQCRADHARLEATMQLPGVPNVAVVAAAINDLGGGMAADALYATVTAPYVADLRASGYRVAISTVLPQTSANYAGGAGANAAIEERRTAYNLLVRGNSAGADAVVDLAADATMGAYPDAPDDLALYADWIHPTSRGYQRLAPLYAAAINGLLG